MENKPKILLITLSISEEASPISPENLNLVKKYSRSAHDILSAGGMNIIKTDEIIEDNISKEKAIKFINKESPECILFQIGVWPSTSFAVDIISNLKKKTPVILWSPDDLNLLSFVPACQFHGAFDDMDIKHEFIYSDPEKKEFIEKVRVIASASKVVTRLSGSRLGLFGGRYMHMYTGTVDPVQVKKIFGVEIDHINEFCLVKEAQNSNKKEVDKYSKFLHQNYGSITAPPDVEEKSIRLYLAMEKMRKKYDLDFATVKCMLEVQGDYCSHCLSVSRHIDENFIISCEADINGAITMQLLKLLTGSAVGFGDICRVDKKTGELTVLNCGAIATKFAKSYKDVRWPEQKKDLVPGKGTGMTSFFTCKPGSITLARLGRIKGKYVMQICTGEAFDPGEYRLLNSIMPHLFVKLDCSDLEGFIQNCRSNHQHWVYGDFREELIKICDILDIEPILC